MLSPEMEELGFGLWSFCIVYPARLPQLNRNPLLVKTEQMF